MFPNEEHEFLAGCTLGLIAQQGDLVGCTKTKRQTTEQAGCSAGRPCFQMNNVNFWRASI